MRAKLCCVVFLGALILGVCNALPLSSEEEEARKFAEDASAKLYSFYDELVNNSMNLENDDLEGLFNALETLANKAKTMSDISQSIIKFDQSKLKDEELRYIIGNLRKTVDESIVGGEKFIAILFAMGFLEQLAADRDIEGYKNENLTLAYFPDVQNVFAKSNDPEELKYYWNEWREKNVKWAMSSFVVLVDAIKEAANLTGVSADKFWMKDYNMTQMDEVMNQIQPYYRQLHGFIRDHLHNKYGDAVIKKDGLIPDHLFQQVLAQAWTKGSILEEHFPHENLPQYDKILKEKQYDTMKLYKMADKFYESMGFEALPESYWGTRLKMKTDDDEGDCRATVLAASQNVFMQYCHKMDFRKFMQAHGYMAELHYALEKANLPAYFFDAYDLEYAIGEAVILSASSPKHLISLGLIENSVFNEEVFMNRLTRLSFHTMLNIPVYYVHTKAMNDLFAGKIEMTELNKHYWALMDKYVGVEPPSDRVSDTFDFPFKFYMELNENEQARKFNSEVLSYQLHMKLCSLDGQFPEGKIQNCDFYGSKVAGDALKKMMKLGSSKPFREVLSSILPEDPRVNAESLLYYYFPTMSWISVYNMQKDVKIGWTHSDKKIGSVTLPDVEIGDDDDD